MSTPPHIQEAIQIALRYHQAGDLQQAEALYHQVLEHDPNNADALHLLGLIASERGQFETAAALIKRAIAANPKNPIYHNNLGEVYLSLKDIPSAISCYQEAIRLQSDFAEAYYNLGNLFLGLGRIHEAIPMYRETIRVRPSFAGAHNNLGAALREIGQLTEAIQCFQEAIRISPGMVNAYINLGRALGETGWLTDGIAACRKAIELAPDVAEAYAELAVLLLEAGQLDEAIAACRRAIRLKPDLVAAHNNLGLALRDQGRLDEAVAAFDAAIALQADFAEAHWNKALALLLKGDFERGLPEYEWRRMCKDLGSPERIYDKPMWTGDDPGGRAIFLYGEQGFGDIIMCLRYVPLLVQRGATVMVEAPVELHQLIRNMGCVWQVLRPGEVPPAFAAYASLLSLPFLFGTRLDTIPGNVPYLMPEEKHIARWRFRTASDTGLFKVGLVWASGPASSREMRERSTTLSTFAPLAGIQGVRFYSLQKGPPAGEAATPPAGFPLVDFTSEINDFADTAGLMVHLDLIISVDTAVAHLAGAMAKPVWILLPYRASWQWMSDREDSPWYPTARLFRQRSPGNWDEVILRVRQELEAIKRKAQNATP